MSELPHEHTPDTTAFLTATLKTVDHEYEFVAAKIGQDAIIQDRDKKQLAVKALGLLQNADLDAFIGDQGEFFAGDESMNVSLTDEASLEHLRLLAGELGTINGYRLTLITDSKIILDQIVRTKDDCLMTISLEASLSPLGVYVAKDRHIAITGRAVMKDPLEVGPEDIAIVDQFVQKLIDLN